MLSILQIIAKYLSNHGYFVIHGCFTVNNVDGVLVFPKTHRKRTILITIYSDTTLELEHTHHRWGYTKHKLDTHVMYGYRTIYISSLRCNITDPNSIEKLRRIIGITLENGKSLSAIEYERITSKQDR